MWPTNHLQTLLGIEHPIIQAGMVWVSGAKLASAVSNVGGLGVIGAGSMPPDVLRAHIRKTQTLTNRPFGVNIPLMYDKVPEQISVCLEEKVKIFITSAGSPKTWTSSLKKEGARVIHVISNPLFAKKAEEAGVDAIVAEGFEAGGHNGREELTSLILMQLLQNTVSAPIILAGGIGHGSAILAAFALGASGVQLGTLFASAQESSAHDLYKKSLIDSSYDATDLLMKKVMPVRLLKNPFSKKMKQIEEEGANEKVIIELSGKNRAKKGIFEGDLIEGKLEAGQIASLISHIKPASKIMEDLITQYKEFREKLSFLNK